MSAKVAAIQEEAKRIDGVVEGAQTAELRRASVELPHWEFSGTFERSLPVWLTARLSEGDRVREESYYLVQGKPILVRVESWWDVEDPAKAPGPPESHVLYLDDGYSIRHERSVNSKPPNVRTDDTRTSAGELLRRARSIAEILDTKDKKIADSLRTFTTIEPEQ